MNLHSYLFLILGRLSYCFSLCPRLGDHMKIFLFVLGFDIVVGCGKRIILRSLFFEKLSNSRVSVIQV